MNNIKADLSNRTFYTDGNVRLKESGIVDFLYVDPSRIADIVAFDHNDVEQYNRWHKIFGIDKINSNLNDIDHNENQQNWFLPDQYKALDVIEFLINKCNNDLERERVAMELDLFLERNMENVLKFLIYLVDTMRANNVVWGVGRGSSVSSYCLYLIGIHKIDSIKYELDIREFLK